ncbi:MAG: hypothetical protein ACK52J_03510 [bacterium]
MKNLNNSCLDEIIVTNTIPKKENETDCQKIKRLSVGKKFKKLIFFLKQ